MTFSKPSNVRVTDMCIYIDENAYKEDRDERKIYEYLYHIIYSIASRNNLFNYSQYYDPFAIFGASKIYMRLLNSKQFEYDQNGKPKVEKIKSILNYINKSLYYLKVDFEQTEYSQTLSTKTDYEYDRSRIIDSYVDKLKISEFDSILEDVSKVCSKFLQTLPYKTNSVEWLNIYISVVLTLIDKVSLSRKQKNRIDHLEEKNHLKDSHIYNFYEELDNRPPILFHIDPSLKDYITVLVRQLKHILSEDLSQSLQDCMISDLQISELSSKKFYREEINDSEYEDS